MRSFSFRPVLGSLALIGLLVVQVIMSPLAYAAPGDLDPTFGMGGKVTTDLGADDEILAIAVQPDGKILAAGETFNSATNDSDVALARYTPNGSLDLSFGSGGVVTTDLGGNIDYADAIALQPDGKIVVSGGSQGDFALARYAPNGTLDPAFGVGGEVLTDFGGALDAAGGLSVQLDGKIVAGGYVNSDLTGADFGLARYEADGSLDQSFGQGGRVVTNIEDHSASAGSLLLQPDGKIVLGGGAPDGLALARYRTNGSLDSAFGVGGIASGLLGGTGVEGLALQPDGKLIAVGRASVTQTDSDFAVERLNASGGLDSTFGSAGQVITDIGGEDFAPDVAIQPDGRIVVAGNSFGNNTWRVALVRYNTDGSLDATFGVGGVSLTTPFSDLVTVALQPDGKIIAGGIGSGGVGEDMALARYDGDPAIVTPTISSFAPRSGPVGTIVTVSGTNLADVTSVWFDGVAQPSFMTNLAGTRITAAVPAGATTGPIRVLTPYRTATSSDSFVVTSAGTHVRSVTLRLWGHLRFHGVVGTADGFTGCSSGVSVKIQRRGWLRWITLATVSTDSAGVFTGRLADIAGLYRAKVDETTLPRADVCGRAYSPRTHREAGLE